MARYIQHIINAPSDPVIAVFVAAGADAVLALALIMADDVHKGFVVVGGGAGGGAVG